MDAQCSLFSSKPPVLGLSRWTDNFWGIWGILGQFISTHFGAESLLYMFSIHQSLFLQKTKPLCISKYQIFIWDWDFGRKELGV
jgi:hypothetical protein